MYTLRFRFNLPPDRGITSEAVTQTIGALPHTLEAEPAPPGAAPDAYALKVVGFASPAEAEAYVARVRVALAWLLLEQGLAAQASFDVQIVRHSGDPGALPMPIDGSRPAVYRTGVRLSVVTGFAPQIRQDLSSYAALELVSEAVEFPNFERLATDTQFATAMDLYRAHFTESSAEARFLTLIMSLEALTVGALEPPRVLELIDRWRIEINAIGEDFANNLQLARSLASLDGTLSYSRLGSISSRIRSLIVETLSRSGDADAQALAREASTLYGLRSELVHNGRLREPEKLGPAIERTRAIANRVLRARFLELVG